LRSGREPPDLQRWIPQSWAMPAWRV